MNMSKNIIIAIDAMGGDYGPETVLAGVEQARHTYPEVAFHFYGQQNIITPILNQYPALAAVSTIIDCEKAVGMDEKPSYALRSGRRVSSMWRAIEAVKDGTAHAVISAGNTGALMAMAKVILRMVEGVERPAISAVWPTLRGESLVLDLGATIGCTAQQFAQFAVMGSAYSRILFGIEKPSIGLLNIGVEDVKGTDSVRQAAEFLQNSELNFIGFVEGDGIGRGDADVIVTDGFTGNIALKTAEGTARQFAALLRQAISHSWVYKIGYLFARDAFRQVRDHIDPNNSNGGMFLGLNGLVVKSHGGANADGFAAALGVAIEAAKADMMTQMRQEIDTMQHLLDDAWAEELK